MNRGIVAGLREKNSATTNETEKINTGFLLSILKLVNGEKIIISMSLQNGVG